MATAKAKGSRYQTETGMIFNAEKWLHEFRKPNKFREMRVRIMEGTLEACALFHYILPNGELVSLGNETSVSEEARKTRLYNDTDDTLRKVRAEKPSDGHKTTVEVVNRDCLEEALRLKKLGLNPAVLNMASRRRPGMKPKLANGFDINGRFNATDILSLQTNCANTVLVRLTVCLSAFTV